MSANMSFAEDLIVKMLELTSQLSQDGHFVSDSRVPKRRDHRSLHQRATSAALSAIGSVVQEDEPHHAGQASAKPSGAADGDLNAALKFYASKLPNDMDNSFKLMYDNRFCK